MMSLFTVICEYPVWETGARVRVNNSANQNLALRQLFAEPSRMLYNETPRSAWTGSETIHSAFSYVKHEFVVYPRSLRGVNVKC